MRLPFFLKLDKKKPVLFLVLVLRNEKVNAVIFEERAGSAQVVGEHEEYLQNPIDSISVEEFLDILDRTISKAQSALPENSEPQKTIFGVKENWIENDKIKKEHLLRLKKACDELGLTPIGFLIISQAISYLLQKEEGAPLSAIFVNAEKTSVTISLVMNGRILATKSKNIEDDLPITVDNLLKEFTTQENLPSRIIIFDGKSDLSQKFIGHPWSKTLRFLHLPQVTTLPGDFVPKAVLFGVATQMGFYVLDDVATGDKDSKKNPPQEVENLPMENFGFIKDKDIAEVKEIKESLEKKEQEEDVVKTEIESSSSTKPNFQTKTTHIFDVLKNIFHSVKEMLSKTPRYLPPFSFPISNKKAIFIPVIVVVLLIGSITFYLFTQKTTVLLDIKPEIIKQDNNIIFSIASQTDQADSIVRGRSISVSLSGEVSTSTTGKKEVGTKAKGEVTIFNNTDSSKTFSKGTIITAANDLNFILEENITVASASGDVFSGTTPGKTSVDVTAEEIGTQFNLPSNTKFSIGDNPSIAAKNDEPFSGGTKKEIAVVSQNDIDKLLEELPNKLRKKGKEELPKQISADETLLPVVLETLITKKDFNKDIADEADRLTLKGTVVYKAIAYNKKDLLSQSASFLEKDVEKDQVIDEDKIKVDVKNIKQKSEKEVGAILKIEGVIKPRIDEKELINIIAGMPYKDAEKKLLSLPQMANVSISPSLDIPFLPKMLPKISKNIKIIVNTQ